VTRWYEVRPGRVVSGVVWGAVLVALVTLAWPHARAAWRMARLLSAEPPARVTIPVRGVEPGAFSDTWGADRSGGRSHQGIDIFARRNTPVVSATEGVVVRAGENALGGRTITVMGPGGWRHYYAHLEKWAGREEGDWVLPGDVIGFVGTTGNAPRDAPHLHYGIYTREGAINPFPFLVARPDTLLSDTLSSGAGIGASRFVVSLTRS
jgi:murein DD-endopeptidase MepM/ murein hydrolase activator NlpD